MKERVAVVVPSFNHETYVVDAVSSALEAGADEVIVVDDGSTDASFSRLAQEFAGDSRVRLERQSNAGAHASLNRAVELSTADWVMPLNSDDRFHPDRIRRILASVAGRSDIALIGSWLELIDDSGRRLGIKEAWRNLPPWPQAPPGLRLGGLADPELALLESNYLSTTSNCAFRRALFRDRGLRFRPLRYVHDWDFFLAASTFGRVHVVEEPLTSYRVHARNTLREADAAEALGAMRFEILWTVAWHARDVLRNARSRGFEPAQLASRIEASIPAFGRLDILRQLLALRDTARAGDWFLDLLRREHPYRRSAEAALSR